MSLAEKFERKGELKGKLEGALEVAKNMILEGSDQAFIMKVTKLPLDKIQSLQKEYQNKD